MNKEKSVFEVLSAVDVSDKIQRKGKFSYLTWSWAWGEVAKRYPDATYSYFKDEQTNLPMIFVNGVGGFCYTSVTIKGNTLQMWLSITDNKNNPIMKPNVTQINTTLMRCFTKNLAMHGLGLYIYQGEDLPEVPEVSNDKPVLTQTDLKATLKGTKENARKVLTSYDVSDEYKKQIINKFK